MIEPRDKKEIENMINLATSRTYQKRVGDSPNDSLQLVPKKFILANGSVLGRPTSSVASTGQFYLSTDLPSPMWFTSAGWVNGVGSIIAQP